ncbi:pyridoxal-phosphate dependent enzyme [Paracoccaceae bacterium]|nr:pyridoxal-phosphate dependent enzyme [Paracoccaceae bacterium]
MQKKSIAEAAFKLTLRDFEQAAERISKDVIVTPLLPYNLPDRQLALKAECLQELGSFKIRAGANAIETASDEDLLKGVVTASAGNFGQGVAKAAQNRGLPVHVIVPDTAAKVKVEALIDLGATVTTVPFSDWWNVMMTRSAGVDGFFIHPVAELEVIIGNGGIGLEIFTQCPNVDVIIIPFGGGGMISGIALAMKALGKTPKIIACEIESSTPLKAAKKQGEPVKVERGKSWVDGIGSTTVLPEMWPLLDELVDKVIVVSHREAENALRLLSSKSHLISEGAGAVALAAALRPEFSGKNIVAVISGSNIDPDTYTKILNRSYI